jgi:hypothetical protein
MLTQDYTPECGDTFAGPLAVEASDHTHPAKFSAAHTDQKELHLPVPHESASTQRTKMHGDAVDHN